MKKIIPLLAGAAMLVLAGATGCAQKAGTGDETLYKRVPAKEHQVEFPNGHDGSKSCYYDEKGDVYFCSYY